MPSAGFGVPQPVQNLALAAFRVPQGPFQPPSAACCGFGVPQPTQNLLLASFRVPQGPVQPPSAAAAVCAGFGVPQPVQNLLPAAFCLPQGPIQSPAAGAGGMSLGNTLPATGAPIGTPGGADPIPTETGRG